MKHSLASVKVLKEQLGLRQLTAFVEELANLCGANGCLYIGGHVL